MLTAIRIGSLSISTYWLMLLIGAVGMGAYTWHRREVYGLTKFRSVTFAVLLTTVGFSGAKLLFIAENLSVVLEEGISLGGVSFFGSVFLIPLVMPWLGRLLKLRAGEAMDLCGPCVAIMICCMRFGCFFQDCCGGWQVCMGDFCFRWPTQAIESIADFIIFLLLLRRYDQKRYEGLLYPMFMVQYSGIRFLIEFLRDTSKDWLGFSHGQWFAAVAFTVGIVWISLCRQRAKSNDKSTSGQ